MSQKLLHKCVHCLGWFASGGNLSLSHNRWIASGLISKSVSSPSAELSTPPDSVDKPKPKRKCVKKAKAVLLQKLQTPSKSPPPLSAPSRQMLDYVKSVCGSENVFTTKLISKRMIKHATHPNCVYLIDNQVATSMAKSIAKTQPDVTASVLELHAGLGLLTSKLLSIVKFKYLTVFEDYSPLGEHLAQTLDVSVIDCSADDLPRHHHLDKHDGGERINSILTSITPGASPRLYITGTIPNVSSINFLIRSLVTKRIFFEEDLPWSKVSLYVALGPKPAFICTATPASGKVAYRPTSILFQTLFQSKFLDKLPRNAFIPWETVDNSVRKGPTKRKLKLDDPDNFKLVQIDINYSVLEKIGQGNLLPYWYFVRQHLHSRTNRIIPELERWIPGCGVKLIKKGFTIYSQFGDLEPEQILNLFLEFISWPEFESSSYLNAVEKYQTRLELSEEDESK